MPIDLSSAIMQAIAQSSPPATGFTYQPDRSAAWNAIQTAADQEALAAGLPAIAPNPGQVGPYRARLQDAIARAIGAGVDVPHFIGTPTEPTGDRSGTMDIENLVNGLKVQELAAAKSGDVQALNRISRERAYWESQIPLGMSAAQWKEATGENDPRYGLQFFPGMPALRENKSVQWTSNSNDLRPDGTLKQTGFLGILPMTDGSGRVMTEFSVGIPINGKEMDVPTLVPTLSKQEIDYLRSGNDPTPEIIRKAGRHAQKRISEGKSPFASNEETPR